MEMVKHRLHIITTITRMDLDVDVGVAKMVVVILVVAILVILVVVDEDQQEDVKTVSLLMHFAAFIVSIWAFLSHKIPQY